MIQEYIKCSNDCFYFIRKYVRILDADGLEMLMDLYPYLDANNVIGISAPVSSGNNEFGQLGLNDTTDRSTPVQVVSAGLGWKQVSCGKTHILAVKTDGSLWGSGNNQFGQIGQNNTLNKSSPTQVGTNYSWFDSACG